MCIQFESLTQWYEIEWLDLIRWCVHGIQNPLMMCERSKTNYAIFEFGIMHLKVIPSEWYFPVQRILTARKEAIEPFRYNSQQKIRNVNNNWNVLIFASHAENFHLYLFISILYDKIVHWQPTYCWHRMKLKRYQKNHTFLKKIHAANLLYFKAIRLYEMA